MFRSLRDKLLTLPGSVRGVARPPRRLAVRRARHGHEGLLDDRLRARAQRPAGRGRRGRASSRARSARWRRSRRTSRRSSPSTAGRCTAAASSIEPLTPRQVEAKQADGALVVDVRTDLQFDDAHIPGAVCNPAIRAGFGTKLAWVADRDREIVLVGPRRRGRDPRRAPGGRGRASRNIAGYLAGGMTSWREEKRPTEAHRAHRRSGSCTSASTSVQVLDVREQREWEQRPHPRLGARALPRHRRRSPTASTRARPVAVICSSGQRSAVAASLLRRLGAEQVIHVADGGVGTWREHGWPIEEPDRQPLPTS